MSHSVQTVQLSRNLFLDLTRLCHGIVPNPRVRRRLSSELNPPATPFMSRNNFGSLSKSALCYHLSIYTCLVRRVCLSHSRTASLPHHSPYASTRALRPVIPPQKNLWHITRIYFRCVVQVGSGHFDHRNVRVRVVEGTVALIRQLARDA